MTDCNLRCCYIRLMVSFIFVYAINDMSSDELYQ